MRWKTFILLLTGLCFLTSLCFVFAGMAWTERAEPPAVVAKGFTLALEQTEEAEKAASERGTQKLKAERVDINDLAFALAAVRILQSGMRNPRSLELDDVLLTSDHTLCIAYRATNAFNTLIQGRAVLSKEVVKTSDQDGFILAWTFRCAGKPGKDLTHVRHAL